TFRFCSGLKVTPVTPEAAFSQQPRGRFRRETGRNRLPRRRGRAHFGGGTEGPYLGIVALTRRSCDETVAAVWSLVTGPGSPGGGSAPAREGAGETAGEITRADGGAAGGRPARIPPGGRLRLVRAGPDHPAHQRAQGDPD